MLLQGTNAKNRLRNCISCDAELDNINNYQKEHVPAANYYSEWVVLVDSTLNGCSVIKFESITLDEYNCLKEKLEIQRPYKVEAFIEILDRCPDIVKGKINRLLSV